MLDWPTFDGCEGAIGLRQSDAHQVSPWTKRGGSCQLKVTYSQDESERRCLAQHAPVEQRYARVGDLSIMASISRCRHLGSGTAFTREERGLFGLDGMLPYEVRPWDSGRAKAQCWAGD